jgi:hypothetical protein
MTPINYTYTINPDTDCITSITIGDTVIDRAKLINVLSLHNSPNRNWLFHYPFYEEDIEEIVKELVLARMFGEL